MKEILVRFMNKTLLLTTIIALSLTAGVNSFAFGGKQIELDSCDVKLGDNLKNYREEKNTKFDLQKKKFAVSPNATYTLEVGVDGTPIKKNFKTYVFDSNGGPECDDNKPYDFETYQVGEQCNYSITVTNNNSGDLVYRDSESYTIDYKDSVESEHDTFYPSPFFYGGGGNGTYYINCRGSTTYKHTFSSNESCKDKIIEMIPDCTKK